MFTTLLVKEMHETIITGKFLIASLLCIILIPLGMYVTLKEYEQRITDYRNAEQLYEQRSEGNVRAVFKAEGFRPPSPLSVFASGLEQFMPNKAVTSDSRYAFGESTDGVVKISNETSLHNPLSLLFGKLDFLTIIGFVLSIFVLLSTFSLITGEREQGTLKMMLSNTVPRWLILVSKITGNFIVFLVPFLLAFVIGIVILILSGSFSMSSDSISPAVMAILTVSVLFFLCLYTWGVLISTVMHNSITSIVTLLLIWTMFAMVIPKLSPMIAQIIRPVESDQVFTSHLKDARTDIKKELSGREDELFRRVMGNHGRTTDGYFEMDRNSDERKAIENEYDELVIPVRQQYADRLVQTTNSMQRDHTNSIREQERLSMMISRLSPVSCFTYMLTELAGTGLMEIDNFTDHAEQFQDQVKQTIYDKYDYRQYGVSGGGYNMGYWERPDVDYMNVPVPIMDEYRYTTLGEVFGSTWLDLLLLVFYTILFFAGAFVKFLRYDVR